jgi:alpha-ketoglutaric semialdehyde dehydrogenase
MAKKTLKKTKTVKKKASKKKVSKKTFSKKSVPKNKTAKSKPAPQKKATSKPKKVGSTKPKSFSIQEIPEKGAELSNDVYTINNFIQGSWQDSNSRMRFLSINPANKNDIVAEVSRSNYHDIKDAIRAAKEIFPDWRSLTPQERANILERAAQLLEEQKELLSNTIVREVGNTKSEADDEVNKAIKSAHHLASLGSTLESTSQEVNGTERYLKREPVGAFVIITPWCSPLELPVNKIFSALVAGNTVVFKPAREASTCAYLLVKILEEAGIQAGVLNLINGSGSEIGSYLITHNEVDGISFTGCTNVGKLVGASCGTSFKKHELHLGDKSSMIVLEDADIKLAVKSALIGAFRNAGQKCNSTSRIIVLNKVYDEFVKKFITQTNKLVIGPGENSISEIGPVINEESLRKVKEFVRVGRNEDRADMICGGGRYSGENCENGFFYQPTVFLDVTPEMHIATQEVLGPVVCIMRARNEADAVRISNDSRYGLVSSVFSSSPVKARRVANLLDVGIVNINTPTIYCEPDVPFGGRKHSGTGARKGGNRALDSFTELKVICMDKD